MCLLNTYYIYIYIYLQKEYAQNQFKEKFDALDVIGTALQGKGVQITNDSFKYDYTTDKNSYGKHV